MAAYEYSGMRPDRARRFQLGYLPLLLGTSLAISVPLHLSSSRYGLSALCVAFLFSAIIFEACFGLPAEPAELAPTEFMLSPIEKLRLFTALAIAIGLVGCELSRFSGNAIWLVGGIAIAAYLLDRGTRKERT